MASHQYQQRSPGLNQYNHEFRDQPSSAASCFLCSSDKPSRRAASSCGTSRLQLSTNQLGRRSRHSLRLSHGPPEFRSTSCRTCVLFRSTSSALPGQLTTKRTVPIPPTSDSSSGAPRRRRASSVLGTIPPFHFRQALSYEAPRSAQLEAQTDQAPLYYQRESGVRESLPLQIRARQ